MVGMGTNIQNTAYPVGSCLYVISNNTQAKFDIQFMEKLSNTEAELEKYCL